jgi:hypothetical protein
MQVVAVVVLVTHLHLPVLAVLVVEEMVELALVPPQ